MPDCSAKVTRGRCYKRGSCMQLKCPACSSDLIKKNGHTASSGKQNYRCLTCGKQFVADADKKVINDYLRLLIRKALLERVSLAGLCRIFEISMPWLLGFIEVVFKELPEHLNANVTICESTDIDIVEIEADELWSFVQKKKNRQWLWLAIHRSTGQILAMHVGGRDEFSAEAFYEKLPEIVKKNDSFIQTYYTLTRQPSILQSILHLNIEERLITWSELTARCVSEIHD